MRRRPLASGTHSTAAHRTGQHFTLRTDSRYEDRIRAACLSPVTVQHDISVTLQACRFMLKQKAGYLVDSGKDGVRVGTPKGIDHLSEDDRHDHLRHAARNRGNRADQHQHHVRDVRVLEQVMERHLGHLVLSIVLLFSTVHFISSSCRGWFSHAYAWVYGSSCCYMESTKLLLFHKIKLEVSCGLQLSNKRKIAQIMCPRCDDNPEARGMMKSSQERQHIVCSHPLW